MGINESLKYVYYKNLTNVPLPTLKDMEKSFDLLECSVNYFEKNLRDKKYIFALSNGEKLELEIFESNLAHLLGIITLKYYSPNDKIFAGEILNLGSRKKVTSYQILKGMLEKKDEVIKHEYDTGNNNVNFYRIFVKSSIFQDATKLNDFTFGVIKLDPLMYQKMNGIFTKIKSRDLIIFPSENFPTNHSIFGIKKANKCILETLMNHTINRDFVSGQTIAFPTKIEKILINGEKEICKEISIKETIELLNFYKQLVLNAKKDLQLDVEGFSKVIIQRNK